jgi:hypothetical protein
MRSPRIAACLLVLVSCRAAVAQKPADTARALIEQAVAAHGGEERLARDRADKVKFKGTLYVPDGPAAFVAETTVQLPAQYKSVMELTDRTGQKHTLIHILNGDKVTVQVDGKAEKVNDAVLAEMREMQQLDRAIRLVPLLRDRTFDMAPVEDVKVNDRPASGVRVTARGGKGELRLYFDKELGLLVKVENLLDDGAGKKLRQERYFGDFKDIAGYKRPMKVIAFRDGKKVMEAEMVDVKSFEKIDDREFQKP